MSESHQRTTKKLLRWVMLGLIHIAGSAFVFLVLGWIFLGGQAGLLVGLAQDSQLSSAVFGDALLLAGLSGSFWVMLYLLYRWGRQSLRSKPRVVVRARGAVMTETLIVLPVFFLLTMGLAQLSINSMAGILTSAAAYEAGRTAAIWSAEIGEGRLGGAVTLPVVRNKARAVAAGTVTPVVPTSYAASCNPTEQTIQFMLAGLEAAGHRNAPTGGVAFSGSEIQFARGFDVLALQYRGKRKLELAWCSMDVFIANAGPRSNVETRIVYHHPAVFPLVGLLFSSGTHPVWSMRTSAIERTYTMRSPVAPNRRLPR